MSYQPERLAILISSQISQSFDVECMIALLFYFDKNGEYRNCFSGLNLERILLTACLM